MSRIPVIAMLTICLSALIVLSGCGNQTEATLEDIAAANAEITKTINDELVKPEGMDAEVSFSGDSFDIVYTFKESRDETESKYTVEGFKKNTDVMKESWEGAISELEKQTGISGIIGTIIIKSESGKEMWSHDYPEQ